MTGFPALSCPTHNEPLSEGVHEVRCPQGHGWPVREGIARFVPESDDYAGAFGLQWQVYRKTQLDSYTGLTITAERTRRCIGETLWSELGTTGAGQLLEVGCGAGRFTEILLAGGAAVTSVDLSSAVDANQANFPQSEKHRIIQASALQLPFLPGSFDVVFCLGVVQHTPSPEETINKLFAQVRPGGWLVIDHYTASLDRFTTSAVFARVILKRLPPEQGLKWTRRLVSVFLPWHRRLQHRRLLWSLLCRISPIMTYYRDIPELNERLQKEWAELDTHDTLTDWYRHLRSEKDIRRLLESVGATDIWSASGGNGVEARCRRPLVASQRPAATGTLTSSGTVSS